MKAKNVYLESGIDADSAISEILVKHPFTNAEKGIEVRQIGIAQFSQEIGTHDGNVLDIGQIVELTPTWDAVLIDVDNNAIARNDSRLLLVLQFSINSEANFAALVGLQYSDKNTENWQNFGTRLFVAQHMGEYSRESTHVAVFDIAGDYRYRLNVDNTAFSSEIGKTFTFKNAREFIIGLTNKRYQ